MECHHDKFTTWPKSATLASFHLDRLYPLEYRRSHRVCHAPRQTIKIQRRTVVINATLHLWISLTISSKAGFQPFQPRMGFNPFATFRWFRFLVALEFEGRQKPPLISPHQSVPSYVSAAVRFVKQFSGCQPFHCELLKIKIFSVPNGTLKNG